MRAHILHLLQHQPFQPFRMHLTDRATFEVYHPEDVRVTESTVRLGRTDPAAPNGFKERVIIALNHVVSIEPITADVPAIVSGKKL
jgi:hypothetical protein